MLILDHLVQKASQGVSLLVLSLKGEHGNSEGVVCRSGLEQATKLNYPLSMKEIL